MAKDRGLERKVNALVGDLHDRWEMPDHAFDCAFAITVIDNFITDRSRGHFMKELLRVLSEDGLFVLECYDADDEYYGKILDTSGLCTGKTRTGKASNTTGATGDTPQSGYFKKEPALWNFKRVFT